MAGIQTTTDRRRFLLTSGAALAGTGAAFALPGQRRSSAAERGPGHTPAPPVTSPARRSGRAAPYGATTLDTTARLAGSGGYRRLTSGPGWPLVVRSELAGA